MANYYTTKQGETFDIISENCFDTPHYMHKIIELNPSYSDTLIFESGVTLLLPEIDSSSTSSYLPPWRNNSE